MRPLLVTALASLLLAVTLAGCGSSKVSVPDGSVAQVADTSVPKARVDSLLTNAKASYKAQNKPFPKDGTAAYKTLRSQAIAYLVQAAMFEQQAAEMDINVTQKQVDAAIATIKQQSFGGSEKQFQAALKAQGLTKADVESDERLQLTETAIQKKVTGGVKVSDKDAKAYYASHTSSFTQPQSRSVRHILVAKKALADSIYRQLRHGADFAKLAKKYSTDTGSKARGGKLTDVKGTLVPSFEKVALSLKTKEISKPVHSQYGWHVIQALGPVEPPSVQPYAAASATIKQQLLQTKQTAAMNDWVKQTTKAFCGDRVAYADGFAPSDKKTDPCAVASTSSSTATATTAS
ncbi:MAG TPA: peptidylprolyl isomerase [Gaiellaceae bacterium]|nr:peptidylprolyl isomerase [Gaiellaceae bacterium]